MKPILLSVAPKRNLQHAIGLLMIILISIAFTSFAPSIPDYRYAHLPFTKKVERTRKQFQKGMVLPFFALEEDYPYKQAIDEMESIGARSVSFFITNYQENIRSNYIYLNRRAIEVHQITEMVHYAHRKGLSVFIFPTLHLQHLGHKEWRGVLKPEDPHLWWRNYARMIRFYVHFARQNQVEMLSIGSELCSMEPDYQQWSSIIRYARQNYCGLLTYSANWDHYKNIPFIKDLDYMGINAYFGLTRKNDPTLQELLDAWKPARERIEEAYHLYRKPLIFTEIGYPSVDGANRDPWNYFATTPVDLEEQALCYEAFVKTWDPPPDYLHGMYFYNWWGPGGLNDKDYTPRGKPASRILANWYFKLR